MNLYGPLGPDDPLKRVEITRKQPERIPTLRPQDIRTKGIRCPDCGCRHLIVHSTRHAGPLTIRHRTCRHCGRTVITREVVQE